MRVTARSVLAALCLTFFVMGGPMSAHAHNVLVGSDPEDGASLDSAPQELTLTYNDTVLDLGAEVVVEGPSGNAAEGEPQVDGKTVTQPLADNLAGGTYDVTWRVTSADGHPISGTQSFTVAGGSNGAAAAGTADDTAAGKNDAAEPTTAPSDDEPAAPEDDSTFLSGDTGTAGAWLAGLGIAIVMGVLAYFFMPREMLSAKEGVEEHRQAEKRRVAAEKRREAEEKKARREGKKARREGRPVPDTASAATDATSREGSAEASTPENHTPEDPTPEDKGT